jgi:alpha-N-arabinofuranosidase
MTGLERNSDIVVMAAYAPLLVNVNPGGMQWESDLIGYDTMHSYGSPSYWAQVMFSKYLGSETLESKLEGAGPKLFYSVTHDSAKKRIYLKLAEAGKLVTLSAHTTQATNTIQRPSEIVPAESVLHGVSEHLRHTVPGYAIQVIELEER